jgi:mannose-6-phosphate isomerase
VDDNGNPRELHTALAVDAIDFTRDSDSCIMRYTTRQNEAVTLVDCDYFTTNIIELNGKMEKELVELDSFVLYMCAEGGADITAGGHTEHIDAWELVMIPAEADSVEIKGEGKLLEVYIK